MTGPARYDPTGSKWVRVEGGLEYGRTQKRRRWSVYEPGAVSGELLADDDPRIPLLDEIERLSLRNAKP